MSETSLPLTTKEQGERRSRAYSVYSALRFTTETHDQRTSMCGGAFAGTMAEEYFDRSFNEALDRLALAIEAAARPAVTSVAQERDTYRAAVLLFAKTYGTPDDPLLAAVVAMAAMDGEAKR